MTNCTMTITGRNNHSPTIGRSGINRFPKERPKEDQPETGTEAERNENPDKGGREKSNGFLPVPANATGSKGKGQRKNPNERLSGMEVTTAAGPEGLAEEGTIKEFLSRSSSTRGRAAC